VGRASSPDGSSAASPHRICRPDGAENYFGLDFYKDFAPDGAGDGSDNSPAFQGWVLR